MDLDRGVIDLISPKFSAPISLWKLVLAKGLGERRYERRYEIGRYINVDLLA